MRHPFRDSVGGFLVGLVAARVIAGGALAEDAFAFVLWALPLLALTGLAARRLAGRMWGAVVGTGASIVFGVVLAFSWTYVVANALGPWFGAFGIPVILLYAVASVNGLFTALVLSPRRWAIPLSLVSALVLAVTGVPGTTWLYVRLTDLRRIEVVKLHWTPGEGELQAVPFMDGKAFGNLSAEDLDTLRPICPSGRLELVAASGSNSSEAQRFGKLLRVLVAFESDDVGIDATTVALPEGARVAVTYRNGSWMVHPRGPPGPRRLRLGPPDRISHERYPVAYVEAP